MENLKRTPLYEIHSKYKGKIIDFAGWELPVQYEGIIQEHETVRNAAGLFDVSHMGEIEVKGKDALRCLQYLVTNDVSKLEKNGVMYSFMCYEDGGVVDDILIYKFDEDYFYLVVNASNVDKDYEWIVKNKRNFDVDIHNISSDVAEVALQGPKAQDILQKLVDFDLNEIGFFKLRRDVLIDGIKCLISRTGYTGEDGFEIYTDNENIATIWEKIMEAGEEYGIKPVGLGCRDTLRFEANLPLYGNELSKEITPLEAGYGYFVKLDKENFIGKEALLKQKTEGLKRKIVGFEMIERGIPRHGYEVAVNGEKIGFVTTGYFSPTLQKSIGLALIDAKYADLGLKIDIMIRNKQVKAEIINKVFYKKNYKK